MLQVKKEYRKFIRRHSWLPKCLRCSKTVTGSSGGSSGTSGVGAGANGGKDFGSHNTSSNPSAPTTDSSGLSPHAASNVGTTSPNNHSNLAAACNNTNLSINVNLNNLALRSPVGPHQLHLMTPSNHNRHPTHQGIQRPLIHQTKEKKNPRSKSLFCAFLFILYVSFWTTELTFISRAVTFLDSTLLVHGKKSVHQFLLLFLSRIFRFKTLFSRSLHLLNPYFSSFITPLCSRVLKNKDRLSNKKIFFFIFCTEYFEKNQRSMQFVHIDFRRNLQFLYIRKWFCSSYWKIQIGADFLVIFNVN